jgi:DNA-binding protein HU-beta
MNLTELKAAVATEACLTQADSEKAVKAVFSSISNALQGGDSVSVIGFGSFSVGDRAARMGRNPSTGEEIKIPAAKVVKFKIGKGLKDAVNTKKKSKKGK